MFSIAVQGSFNASHQLTLYDGSKEHLHDHQWKVKVSVSAEKLDKCDMVMDFCELKNKLDSVLIPLDGCDLGSAEIFCRKNASAEAVAEYIYQNLSQLLPKHVKIDYTEVTEQPGCLARYTQ